MFGTPTRFGNLSGQVTQIIGTAGGLWMDGTLAGTVASSFTSAMDVNGGQEGTTLSLGNVVDHRGAIIVPPGCTDQRVFASGGNPYGIGSSGAPTDADPGSARCPGARVADVAARLFP